MTPEQKKRFKYWQTRTIIATMVGYALFYFVRKNFSLAMPGLEADLGISKTSLGIFLTLNGVVYGLSRFVNGILADRMNARWYMAIGLALCALANFAFGFGEDVSYWITGQHDGSQFTNTMILFMGIMWVINGMLQGTGFPPCARLLTHWIPPKERISVLLNCEPELSPVIHSLTSTQKPKAKLASAQSASPVAMKKRALSRSARIPLTKRERP
jgi:OPA family glycerol-3-phosphate transporter-like MFS transporter/OPA family sugar phosphate sensor protein UhpC-like MFS transporter